MPSFITRCLKHLVPQWAFDRYLAAFNRDGLKKYAGNTGWLLFGRVISYPLAVFSIAIVSRYLGPEDLGRLSYAQSFVAIFVALAALGIDEIVSRDLVRHPSREREILGTAFVAKFLGGLVMFALVVGISPLIHTDPVVNALVILSALTIILNPFTITSQVFSARALSKYAVITMIAVGVALPLLKIGLVLIGASVYWFAFTLVIEIVLGATMLWYFYRRTLHGYISEWSFSQSTLKAFLQVSWPLIVANSIGYIFVKTDQIMLQYLSTPAEVGYYAAVNKLTESWVFIPAILVTALYPAIIAHKDTDRPLYLKRLRDMTLLTLAISLTFSITLFVSTPLIITLLFGDAFLPSITIMYVHVWLGILLSLYAITRLYLVSESKTGFIFTMTVVGTTANIALNYLLIPQFGGVGAAYATVCANGIMLATLLCSASIRKDLRYVLFGKKVVT